MAHLEHTGDIQAPGSVRNPLIPASKVLLTPSPCPQPPAETPINLCHGANQKERGQGHIDMSAINLVPFNGKKGRAGSGGRAITWEDPWTPAVANTEGAMECSCLHRQEWGRI